MPSTGKGGRPRRVSSCSTGSSVKKIPASSMVATFNGEETTRTVTRYLCRAFGFDEGFLLLVDRDAMRLEGTWTHAQGGRERSVRSLVTRADQDRLTGRDKNEIASRLARALGIDYTALTAKRILQLMNARDIAELANAGVKREA